MQQLSDSTDRETETMPSSLRAFEHGSPAVGGSQCLEGRGGLGCWALKWVGPIFCNVCRKTPKKKQQQFFATKGWSWKIQQDIFISRWKSSTFVEFSGNSIWDGQHLWWVWGRLVVAAGAVVGFQRPIGVFDRLASQQNRTRLTRKCCWRYRWHFYQESLCSLVKSYLWIYPDTWWIFQNGPTKDEETLFL